MDEFEKLGDDFVHFTRIALNENEDDIRLFVARMVRKYRSLNPKFCEQLDIQLRSFNKKNTTTRKKEIGFNFSNDVTSDLESGLSFLKLFKDTQGSVEPFLPEDIEEALVQIIQERFQSDYLVSRGLAPTRSAFFLGKPGVGKTISARWLASELNLPLYVLDLTTVMSSFLGQTGANLRAALDFAKSTPCILLLDEIDAVAKRRGDETDVGELKRLVTVMLQEIEEWPTSGLLLAATNHPELIDPALWRRFDVVLEFRLPDLSQIIEAISRFLGSDIELFAPWVEFMASAFIGESYSDIEKSIQRLRRASALRMTNETALIEEFFKSQVLSLDRAHRIELAILLGKKSTLSQYAISDLTGVSRDTIRKYLKSGEEQ